MNIKNSTVVALGVLIILSIFLSVGLFSNMQIKLADNLYGGKASLDSIVIVGIDDQSLQEIGRWPWDRQIIGDLIKELNQSKVIGVDITFTEQSNYGNDSYLANSMGQANVIIASEILEFERINNKIVAKEILEPISELDDVKRGYINVITDADGVTRAVNMDLSQEHKSFSEALYNEYWKKDLENKKSRFLINYVGSPGSFKIYSAYEVLNGTINPEEFKDKLVLIGATSYDLRDIDFVPTSKGKAMTGVEIHANTIQTLIKEDYIREQSKFSIIILMVIACLLILLAFWKYDIKGVTIASVFMFVFYLLLAIKVFDYGIIMDLIYVPLTIFFTYSAETSYRYLTEKKGKQEIKNAFSKYVSNEVVEDIIKNPAKLKLGGTKEDITVFFSDIRGFTTISEGLDPEKLVHLMNEYLSSMTKIVLKHKGVVDKYIGDAIMAFWGAPIKTKNHAKVACKASLEMLEELKNLNIKLKEQGYPEIKIGIGINTGPAVIGNMGSYDRFDYTAMGDTINLGSRLESLTKEHGVKIIISEFTKKEIGNSFKTRKLGRVKVKGKNKPVTIYELVGKK